MTTTQIEEAVVEFMREKWEHRDLPTLFRNLELSGGWNIAPSKCVVHLAKLEFFYKVMFGLFSNGMLPTKMFCGAEN